jgi:hypothetical protein
MWKVKKSKVSVTWPKINFRTIAMCPKAFSAESHLTERVSDKSTYNFSFRQMVFRSNYLFTKKNMSKWPSFDKSFVASDFSVKKWLYYGQMGQMGQIGQMGRMVRFTLPIFFWPNTIWPNAIWQTPKDHFTEKSFDRKKKLSKGCLFYTKKLKKCHSTENLFWRKCQLTESFSAESHLTERVLNKSLYYPGLGKMIFRSNILFSTINSWPFFKKKTFDQGTFRSN